MLGAWGGLLSLGTGVEFKGSEELVLQHLEEESFSRRGDKYRGFEAGVCFAVQNQLSKRAERAERAERDGCQKMEILAGHY